MARKPRIHVPHGVYHVMLRGNNKQKIFFNNADFCRLSLLLQEATIRFECRIHAFCFMNNHIHLALQVGEIPLSKIMQNVGFRYARWLNKQQNRIGHLFQGRYRAILVDHEKYLLTLIRYIHLNPVKAKLVEHPHEYYWSGHNAYIGKNHLPWLTTDWVLAFFSPEKEAAIKNYQNLLTSTDETYEDKFFTQYPVSEAVLGDDEFKMSLLKINDQDNLCLLSMDEIVNFFCKKYDVSLMVLSDSLRHRHLSHIRAEIAWMCLHLKICSIKKIALLFNRSSSHISHIVKELSFTQHEELMKLKGEIVNHRGNEVLL
jgi:REP element-mobilizing transposase RayT